MHTTQFITNDLIKDYHGIDLFDIDLLERAPREKVEKKTSLRKLYELADAEALRSNADSELPDVAERMRLWKVERIVQWARLYRMRPTTLLLPDSSVVRPCWPYICRPSSQRASVPTSST